MIEIVQKGHPALSKEALAIPVEEITSEKVRGIIRDMKEALESQDDGLAIAAPQIGISSRIFIVSGRLFTKNDGPRKDDRVYINPIFTKLSNKKSWKKGEGCLSVRWLYGTVQRHTNVTIEAYDEHGEKFTETSGGMLAHIFQHEVDHLNGVLFDSKAKDIEAHEPEHKH